MAAQVDLPLDATPHEGAHQRLLVLTIASTAGMCCGRTTATATNQRSDLAHWHRRRTIASGSNPLVYRPLRPTARAGSTLSAKKELRVQGYAVRLYRVWEVDKHTELSRPRVNGRVCLSFAFGSRSMLTCGACCKARWQGHDGRAFLRPAPARSCTIERQPAVTALVVREASQDARLDGTRAGALGDCGAVARAETRFVHPLL